METDEWMRVERGEGSRLLTLGCAVSHDLVEVHDEVVKRLRRRQYKDGWEIGFKLRAIPVVWGILQPQFVAVGAEVVQQGNKVVVTFSSVESLLRMFRVDRLVSGGPKYAAVHGVFVRRFKVGAPNPYSGMLVGVGTPLFCRMHNASASSLCTVSGSMLMLKALLLCRVQCLYPPASGVFVLSSDEASFQRISPEVRVCIEV